MYDARARIRITPQHGRASLWTVMFGMAAGIGTGCTTSNAPRVEPPPTFEHRIDRVVSWPTTDWYRGFASTELDGLIAAAERDNLDLLAATARARQADARARAAGAPLLPLVDANGSIAYITGGTHGATARETDWSALLSASYEVDFWGRNRATARSAGIAAVASKADRSAFALSTLAAVANEYFRVLSLRERGNLARANLDATRELLAVIEARFNAGAAAPSELAAQRAAVANAELIVPELARQEIDVRGALALLIGHAPEGFDVAAQNLDGLAEPSVAPGLSAELLLRRPDVFAAEAMLDAAHADLDAARAAMFPALTLTASGGVQDPAVQAAVITLAGTGYSIVAGAALVQSIFDNGRRRAVRDEAAAKEQELLAGYRRAILSALLDVESALSALHHLDLQRAAQLENVTQSERAFEGARLRYRAGSGDYLAVLDAQRTLYAAREQASQYKLARLAAVVALCKALGGGWQAPEATPTTSTREP